MINSTYFIEIHVGGQRLSRWSDDDFDILVPELDEETPFEDRFRTMESTAKLFLEAFYLRMDPMLKSIPVYELFLVRVSSLKINEYAIAV